MSDILKSAQEVSESSAGGQYAFRAPSGLRPYLEQFVKPYRGGAMPKQPPPKPPSRPEPGIKEPALRPQQEPAKPQLKPAPEPQIPVAPQEQLEKQKQDTQTTEQSKTEKSTERCKHKTAAKNSQDRECIKCPPEIEGRFGVPRSGAGHHMSELSQKYQEWVTKLPFPMEFLWKAIDWDGFLPAQCTLLEAKANYEFLFKLAWLSAKNRETIRREFVAKPMRHAKNAVPNPPVWCEWHFLQKVPYEYCSKQVTKKNLTNLKTYWNPMPGTSDYDQHKKEWDDYEREMMGRDFLA